MSAVDMRRRVAEMAPTDAKAARELAERIDDPWYRCQALSYVAEHTAGPRARREVLDRAFSSAEETREPNRVVTVSAWPIRVLCQPETRDDRRLAAEVARLLAVIEGEPHPTRRNDALFALLSCARAGPRPTVVRIVSALKASAAAGHGWKIDRNLKDAAELLWGLGERAEARECVRLIEEPRVRRQAERLLSGASG